MDKLRATASLLSLSALMAIACSTSSPSDGPVATDAGGSDALDDTQPQDAATPDICAIEAAYAMRCNGDTGVTAACTAALRAQCPQSLAYKSAIINADTLTCESATSSCDAKMHAACSNGVLAAATPTPAQAKVRDDLCARCGGGPAAVAQCKKEFFYDASAGGPGAGIVVFATSDAVAQQIDTKCAIPAIDGGNGDCQQDFYDCAAGVYNRATQDQPSECKKPDGG